MKILGELIRFARARRKFWLIPVIVMMVIFGGLLILTQGTAFAPFVYTLF